MRGCYSQRRILSRPFSRNIKNVRFTFCGGQNRRNCKTNVRPINASACKADARGTGIKAHADNNAACTGERKGNQRGIVRSWERKKDEINGARISKEFRVLRVLRCSSRKGEVSSYLMPESHLLRPHSLMSSIPKLPYEKNLHWGDGEWMRAARSSGERSFCAGIHPGVADGYASDSLVDEGVLCFEVPPTITAAWM